MTDTTSKGLLPQLVEVLNALATSQALLTSKVRNANLEQVRGGVLEVEKPLDPRSAAAATSQGSSLLCATVPNEAELVSINNVKSPTDGLELNARISTWGQSNGSVDLPVNDSEVQLSGNLLDELNARLEDALPSSVPTRETIRPTIADGAPGHDDYNYFDELDAKLAELRRPESKSEDRDL